MERQVHSGNIRWVKTISNTKRFFYDLIRDCALYLANLFAAIAWTLEGSWVGVIKIDKVNHKSISVKLFRWLRDKSLTIATHAFFGKLWGW